LVLLFRRGEILQIELTIGAEDQTRVKIADVDFADAHLQRL
jgi:hypothetical protein